MTTMAEQGEATKAMLAEYIRNEADRRHETGAAALRALAAYVEQLPPTDDRLVDLDLRCCRSFYGAPLDVFMPGPLVCYAIRHYRVGSGGWPSHDGFLSALVDMALDDQRTMMEEAGVRPPGLEE